MLDRNLTSGDVACVLIVVWFCWKFISFLYKSFSMKYNLLMTRISEFQEQFYRFNENVRDIVYMMRELIGTNSSIHQDNVIKNVVSSLSYVAPPIIEWLKNRNLNQGCQYSKCGIDGEYLNTVCSNLDILCGHEVKNEDKKNEDKKNEEKKNEETKNEEPKNENKKSENIKKEIDMKCEQNIIKEKNNDDIKSNMAKKKTENIKVI